MSDTKPGRMTTQERREKLTEAVNLYAKGKNYTEIAGELSVSWHTAKKLVQDELAMRAEHRAQDAEREKAIATYEAIIRAGWERFDRLRDASNNVTGVLNAIRAAQEAIDELTGAKAPIKYQEVDEEYDVVFSESPEDAGRLQAED